MINILIVEDEFSQLRDVKETLKNYLGDQVELHPRNIDETEKNLNDAVYLIDALQERKFEEVAEHFLNTNLFIIDACLTGKTDKLGIEFFEYLKKNKQEEFEAIIFSNTPEIRGLIDNEQTTFVSKLDLGIDVYPNDLVELIKEKYQLNGLAGQKKSSSKPSFSRRVKDYGGKYAVQKLRASFITNLEKYIIDSLILLFFYTLLVAAVVSGGLNIFNDITHHDRSNDTMLLKTAEHIFLNLLPIFIVFGFFNYYKTNIRISLLGGNIYAVDDEISTKTMDLSKILFISSIISYVLIKIIEIIFFTLGEVDVNRLIASGVFLLLLMSYFIFLNSKKH